MGQKDCNQNKQKNKINQRVDKGLKSSFIDSSLGFSVEQQCITVSDVSARKIDELVIMWRIGRNNEQWTMIYMV